MKRQQSYAGVSIAFAIVGVCIVGGIVAFALSQRESPPEPKPVAVAPAPAAKPSPPGKTKAELAKEEADRTTAELQAKLAAMPEPKEPTPDSIPGNAVPRSQFRENVVGKSFQEVVKLYGRPDSSMETTHTTWTYRRRTYDPNTGRPDHAATLYFNGPIVERVSFF